MSIPKTKSAAFAALVLACAGAVVYIVFFHNASSGTSGEPGKAAPAEQSIAPEVLAPSIAVRLTLAELKALGIETAVAELSKRPEQIQMSATTALDSNTLAHVHPRFSGEVTQVLVKLGERVRQGQALAMIWSKDLGEKKSEYMDARSQLRMNQEVLERLKSPYEKGAVPERSYRQALRDVESSQIAVDRAYRTLLAWRLSDDEIKKIRTEESAAWPRDTVTAPVAGTIVEKNAVRGELVDPTAMLFQIADLSKIAIWAYAYEEDLPRLRAGEQWTVTLQALPGKHLHGKVGVVGATVDPAQHTVTVQGTVDNPGELLKGGMYATAVISLPADSSQFAVPTTALVDDDNRTVVYVESAKQAGEFERRRVHVQERLPDRAILSGGLQPGEHVVSRGALELDQKARGRAERGDD